MAVLELLKTLPLGETAILCITLQKRLHLRSMCEVRAVTEDPTKDVTAKILIQSNVWLTKSYCNPALHGTRRGKAGTGHFSRGALHCAAAWPRRAPGPARGGSAGGSGGSAAQRRLCALVPNSPPRPQPHGCLQGSEQTSEGKAQAPAWEKSPHTSAGRCVGMGTDSKDGDAGTSHRLGPPACAPAWLEVGVNEKAYSSLTHLPRKSIFTCYHRYTINSGWIEENLESESLFLI